jgi:transcriptional regulator with AAA-type ATPase domain/transcriptional regulatory protein LevR
MNSDSKVSSKLSRKDKVYSKLRELTDKLTLNDIKTTRDIGIDAQTVCDEIGVSRNNVCKELNDLFREKKVIKIIGKPVLYLDSFVLKLKFDFECEEQVFKNSMYLKVKILDIVNYNLDDKFINKESQLSVKDKNILLEEEIEEGMIESDDNIKSKDGILHGIIGAEDSLKKQIEHAKAAILYPPNGLNMIITGPTGVGKTTLVEALYRYAIDFGNLQQNAPFIVFNCADYSDNHQLLVSQLFGYVKGAFTGAEKDKQGLIDYANNGILFLDEVHRLPYEGQEMLFTLMDKGVFRRLGETSNTRIANVLLITATTEDPNSSMLQTFLRRIPVIIKLPSLEERTLKERMSFIFNFFKEESNRIGIPIKVSKEVVKGFMLYECRGNIGQLKSDIQLICARAFLDYKTFNREQVEIKISQISDRVRDGFFKLAEKRGELLQFFNLNTNENIIFDVCESKTNNLNNDQLMHNYTVNENMYSLISTTWDSMSEEGLPNIQKRKIINLKIENYFETLFHGLSPKNPNQPINAITKIVNIKIVEAVTNAIKELENVYEMEIEDRHIYGLVLHINNFIERGISGQVLVHPKQEKIKKDYPKELEIAQHLKHSIENNLQISIPDSEITFLTMFLYAIKSGNTPKSIGVLVISHGKATASTMVDVANTLLETDHAKAIDMPLEEKVEVALAKAISIVKQIDMGKGVLILVDMGSIARFAEIIIEKTGIQTKTIEMVSTAMVIEATRKSLLPNMSLDLLYNDVINMRQFIGRKQVISKDLEQELDLDYQTLVDCDINYYRELLINILDKILIFLNPQKACHLLNTVLDNILENLNKPINNSLNIKFIFHSACMIERVIRKESYHYNDLKVIKKKNPKLFKTIKNNFQIVEETFAISIPDTEIAYIVEIFDLHFELESIS